jgi:hypothetical protein
MVGVGKPSPDAFPESDSPRISDVFSQTPWLSPVRLPHVSSFVCIIINMGKSSTDKHTSTLIRKKNRKVEMYGHGRNRSPGCGDRKKNKPTGKWYGWNGGYCRSVNDRVYYRKVIREIMKKNTT